MRRIERAVAVVLLSSLTLSWLGCASTGGLRQSSMGSAQASVSIVRSAIAEAKTVPAGDVIGVGNKYPTDNFMSLPDHLDSGGKVIANQFAALAQTGTCRVEEDSVISVFTSTREPTVTMTRLRIIPSAGIVVKDYKIHWRGQQATFKGDWVFVDDDGKLAKVVADTPR